MPYLPFKEILSYLTMNPGKWFGEPHLAHLYPAARVAVPEVLRALVEAGKLRTKVDEKRRPLYQFAAPRPDASALDVTSAPDSAASLL